MKTSLFFIFALFTLSLSAQQTIRVDDPWANLTPKEREERIRKRELYKLNKIGATIHTPSKYTKYNKRFPLYCYQSSNDYHFVNRDSSIIIGVSLFGRDSLDYVKDFESNKRIPMFRKNYDPDDQWLINVRSNADSTTFKPIFYSGAQIKKYNADGAVEFFRNCAGSGYKIARILLLNKKYRGIIEITYFIKQNEKTDIVDKEVRKANKMITYN